ncbi:hypothetical protein L6164_013992 [Bauhinia variegata]|uniref:Uncharacterized protein n=1 Tax=Bauhinia variegata TaxID=167791 RepID=A0ACB9NFS8_BAUVA|nr:hypothetical protein L6164_013992 [Bauhinia variegata]
MTMDLRQAFAGLLTLSMFMMLGNMIKKDHFDSTDVNIPATAVGQYGAVGVTGQSLATVSHLSKGHLEGLKPCWNPPASKEAKQTNGFVTFSLTNGPEYHLSQVADAVVIARYLGATLVIPDIKGSKPGYKMNFGEIYDVDKFINSLDRLVEVTKTRPPQASNGKVPLARVPKRVSEHYIVTKIQPIFKSTGVIKIESYFPSVNVTMVAEKKNMDSFACEAMFGSLQLQPEMQEVADSMIRKLKTWSQNLNGEFVAVDLNTEVLDKMGCNRRGDTGKKMCYQAQEVGQFLNKIGLSQETAIYVTQPRWHADLDALRDIFPKTFTKENVMPSAKKGKFLNSESSEFEKAIDFYICSQSDVFVPSAPGLWYENVAGVRIGSGKTQILVPDETESASASPSDYISPYVSQKNHFAYSCFCEHPAKTL